MFPPPDPAPSTPETAWRRLAAGAATGADLDLIQTTGAVWTATLPGTAVSRPDWAGIVYLGLLPEQHRQHATAAFTRPTGPLAAHLPTPVVDGDPTRLVEVGPATVAMRALTPEAEVTLHPHP